MNHALGVRGRQRIGDFAGDAQRFVDAEPLALEPRGQRLARHVLHHDVEFGRVAIADLDDVVNRGDVRMIQRRDGAGLAHGARVGDTRAAGHPAEGLDRDLAPEPDVLSKAHVAHAAGVDLAEDAVWAARGHRMRAILSYGFRSQPFDRPSAALHRSRSALAVARGIAGSNRRSTFHWPVMASTDGQ